MTRSLMYASALVVSMAWPVWALQVPQTLTLAEAMAMAVQRQPSIESARLEVEARAAEVAQAARWLNPSAVVEVEDLGRSIGSSQPSQTTVSVGQRIELGGKRGLRTAVAGAERDLAAGDLLVTRHELEARVATAFVRALAAEAEMGLAEQDAATAVETAAAIGARVNAGVAAPPDADRAQAAAASARIRLRAARQRLDTARMTLAGTWSAPPDEAVTLAGRLDVPAIPPIEILTGSLESSPAVRRGIVDLQRVTASLNMAKSARVPDLGVDVGYRRLHDLSAHSWLIGGNVSLPLFDRQRDRIAAASLRTQSAGAPSMPRARPRAPPSPSLTAMPRRRRRPSSRSMRTSCRSTNAPTPRCPKATPRVVSDCFSCSMRVRASPRPDVHDSLQCSSCTPRSSRSIRFLATRTSWRR